MNRAIANVLNKVLGDWVENLNSEQLKLSVFKGKIELDKVKIKSSAFTKLGFPFHLEYGFIGHIEIDIPWTSLSTSPLRINIDDVLCLIYPSSAENWKEEEERVLIKNSRDESLMNFDSLNQPELTISNEPGYIEKLIETIVNNVQIHIKRVYFRYEDNKTSDTPFVVGVKLLEAKAETCNDEWKPQFIKDSPQCYKLLKVSTLCAFIDYNTGVILCNEHYKNQTDAFQFTAKSDFSGEIDHKYILCPLNCNVEAIIEKNKSENVPKIQVSINQDLFGLQIYLQQISYVMKFLDFFSIFKKFKAGIESTFIYNDMNEKDKANYQRIYMLWRQEFFKNPEAQKTMKLKKELEAIENGVSIDSIKLERSYAIKEEEANKRIEEKNIEIKKLENKEKGGISKMLNIFASKAEKEREQKKEEEEKAMNIKRLKEEISLIEGEKMNSRSTSAIIKPVNTNYTVFLLELKLQKVMFNIFNPNLLLSNEINTFEFKLGITSKWPLVRVYFKSFLIQDHQRSSQLLPFILNSKSAEVLLDKNRLTVNTLGMDIVLNALPLLDLINAIKNELSQSIDLNKMISAASENTSIYIKDGENYVKNIIKNGHTTSIQLDIDIKAPVFYIPNETVTNFLVVDLGNFSLASSQHRGKNDYYSYFKLIVSQIKIATIWKILNLNEWISFDPLLNLDKMQVSTSIYERKEKIKPGFKLVVELGEFALRASDQQIFFILDLLVMIKPKEDIIEIYENIIESENLQEKIIEFGDIIPWVISAHCKKLEISLFTSQINICIIQALGFEFSTEIDMKSNLKLIIGLTNFEIIDPDAKIFHEILKKAAKADDENSRLHLKIILNINLLQNLLNASMGLNELSITIPYSFLANLLSFSSKILKKLPNSDNNNKRISKTYSINTQKLSFSIRILGVNINIPLSPTEKNSKFLVLSTSAMITYNSFTTIKAIYDNQSRICLEEMIKVNKEAGITLSHLEIFVADNREKSVCKYLLNPSRTSIEYSCSNEEKKIIQRVDIRIESLMFNIGICDISYVKEILKIYLPLSDTKKSAQPETTVARAEKFICNIDGDSLQINIQDDTSITLYSVIHIQLSNLSMLMILDIESKLISFSTLFFCNCFNKSLGAWEPLIEDWKLELGVSQEQLSSPLNISLKSEEFLNVNVNLSILSEIMKLISNIQKEVNILTNPIYTEEKNKKINFEYEIFNHLECSIKAKINCVGNNYSWKVDPGHKYSFSHAYVEKLFAINNPNYKSTASSTTMQAPVILCLEIEKFESITGLSIEEVALGVFILQNEETGACFAMEVTSDGQLRQINIMSSVEVCNNSSYPIRLEYNEDIIEIKENSNRSLPLKWNHDFEKINILTDSKEILDPKKYVFIKDKFYTIELYQYDTESDIKYKTIEINPCYSIINLLPCKISVISQGNIICQLDIGEEKSIDVDPRKENIFEIKFLIENEEYLSEEFNFQEKSKIIELKNHPGSSFMIELSDMEIIKNSKANLYQRNRESIVRDSLVGKLLKIYTKIIVVNKSENNLVFNDAILLKHSWKMLNSTRGRVSSSDFPSKSCKEFSLETISIAGLLNIPHKTEDFELNLGVSISLASSPLIYTKIVTIVPRFMISNLLKYSVYVQRFKDTKQIKVESQEVVSYEPGTNEAAIQISADGKEWSGPFALDNIEDFQINFSKSEEQKSKKNKDLNTKKIIKNDKNFVRVMIYTKDEATIHISLSKPKDPDYLIRNLTTEDISVYEINEFDTFINIPPEVSVAWAFKNGLSHKKLIILSCEETKGTYSLDKIKKCKKLGKYDVEVLVEGVTRVMSIYKNKELAESSVEDPNAPSSSIKIVLNFFGLGVSVMDSKNKEQLYISVSDVFLNYKIITKINGHQKHIATKIDTRINNFQIDNMDFSSYLFPVILSRIQMEADIGDNTPFLQFKVYKDSISNIIDNISIEKIRWMELSIQPFQVKINEETIYSLMSLKDLSTAFESLEHLKEFNIDTSLPTLPYKLNEIERKAYLEFLRICAIKIEITFRKSARPLKISFKYGLGVLGVLGTIGGAFANISDSPIRYTEVMVTHCFQTIPNLTLTFTKNYMRQTILQVYKILGSSDMIGNPLGLIDKLGTGVFEFVSEPAKGLLKGPKAFASGVGKGVKSLVGGIIAGGFGSVSKITGSLYNVLKEVGGDEIERRSSKLGVFMLDGIKGGAMDVANGVTGVFTKPFRGAKDQGAKGFFKGVGSGLFGLVSSPVKLVLRLGHTISGGIATSASLMAKGKVHKFGRLRFPRYIGSKKILMPYDSEIAQAQQLLTDEKVNQNIIHYLHFAEENDVIIILTNKIIWLLIDAETKWKIYLSDIYSLEIHCAKGKFVLYVDGIKQKLTLESHCFANLAGVYNAVIAIIGQVKLLPKASMKKGCLV